MEYTLLTGFSYMNMVRRSARMLQEALLSPYFVGEVVALLAETVDEQTGEPINDTDVLDAIFGTERGRKGLLTAYSETLAESNTSSNDHVYEPLMVDGEEVSGCKVYTGEGDPTDPKAPVPGTMYLKGVEISSRCVEKSPNGDKILSKRGAVALAKDFIEARLALPASTYRTFRLLPGEALSLKCGGVSLHAAEGEEAQPGAARIGTLIA
jgi:hypothetical protein